MVKEFTCQFRRPKRYGFDPWAGQISWSRKWQPALLFLPGNPWMEEPGGLQSMGLQKARLD